MILRPYQQAAIDKYMALNAQRTLVVAPTGSGKTVIISELIKQLPGKILFLTHRQEILFQAHKYFGECSVIKSGHDKETDSRITIAQVQTLARRTLPPADIVISDEAHHIRGAQWKKLLDSYPSARHIGMTATPYRLDGKGLGSIYDTVIDVAAIDDLIEQGFLVKPEYYGAKILPNMAHVKKVGGDYSTGETSARCRERTIIAGVVESIRKYSSRHVVVYAVDCKHAEDLCREVPDALYLDGKVGREDRAAMLDRFAMGLSRLIINIGVLTEGWDCLVADCIILARPTCSTSLYLQMVGRGLRPCSGKDNCLIIDHGGNVHRHGFAQDYREYTLADGLITRKSKAADSLHTCKKCLAVFLGKQCPACGAIRETTHAEVKEQIQELQKIERLNADLPTMELAYRKIVAWAKFKKYRPMVAYARFKREYNQAPQMAWLQKVQRWTPRGAEWI